VSKSATDRGALQGPIGVLGPIELAEFHDYLYPGALEGSPPRGMGGTPVTLLCKELLNRDRHLVVFSLDPSVDTEKVFEGERLRIYFGPHTSKAAHNFFRKERQFLSRAIGREKLAVLHAHFTYEYALAAIDSGLPHVVTAHDATLNCLRHALIPFRIARTFMAYYKATRSAAFRMVRTLMAYKAARTSQRLIAVSPYVADHLRRYGFHAKPIDVIPNGMPGAYFERTRSREPGRPLTFATVLVGWGGLKNGGAAIEAFAKVRRALPDAEMLMFGAGHSLDGPAALWARQKGWEGGIEFIGQVPYAQLIDQLSRRVDVLVHPSLEEAHPMPLIEAMSLGIPAIGGRTAGGVPWTLGDGKYGVLVDVRLPDHIACAMLGLAEDEDARIQLGAVARESSKRRFHIRRVASQYEAIYAQLAGHESSSRCALNG
jgi:glycosyltransferase involved in cell wall biosynthesis